LANKDELLVVGLYMNPGRTETDLWTLSQKALWS